MLKLTRVAGKKKTCWTTLFISIKIGLPFMLFQGLVCLFTSVVCSSTTWNIKVAGCLWNFLCQIDAVWGKLNETNSENWLILSQHVWELQSKRICLEHFYSKWAFLMISNLGSLWVMPDIGRHQKMRRCGGEGWDGDAALMRLMCD